jgi:hypothetical protein
LVQENSLPGSLIAELAEPDAREYLKGSANRALDVEPGFNQSVFIERNRERCKELETLRRPLPVEGSLHRDPKCGSKLVPAGMVQNDELGENTSGRFS